MTRTTSLLAAAIAATVGAIACSSTSAPPAPAHEDPPAVAPPSADAGVDAAPPAVDNGAPSNVYPAFNPPAPTVLSLGGGVLRSPVIVPVTFDGDEERDALDAFFPALAASDYFTTVGRDYGIGAARAATAVHVAEKAPASMSETELGTWLAGKLDGTHPEWPAPEEGSIYVVYFPEATTLTLGEMTSCGFGGYHFHTTVGAREVAFAAMPRCFPSPPAPAGEALDVLTSVTTHELLEAASDPTPNTNPAYANVDDDHVAWALLAGGEIGDMCAMSLLGQPRIGAPTSNAVQAIWSNTEAAAGRYPCLPQMPGKVYFNSVPVLNEKVSIDWGEGPRDTKGVVIPAGKKKTIEVDLFSDAALSAWHVSALDSAKMNGQAPELAFTFDRTTGVNGEKLHLTIEVLKEGAMNGSPFIVISEHGQDSTAWVGFVANH